MEAGATYSTCTHTHIHANAAAANNDLLFASGTSLLKAQLLPEVLRDSGSSFFSCSRCTAELQQLRDE